MECGWSHPPLDIFHGFGEPLGFLYGVDESIVLPNCECAAHCTPSECAKDHE